MTETEKIIERYLSNEMSDSEKKEFENRLAEDDILSNAYNEALTVKQFVTEAGRLELKKELESFDAEIDISKKTNVLPLRLKLAIKVAAILLISFGIYQFGFNTSMTSEEIYETYFEVYDTPNTTRGDINNASNWESALSYYNTANYEKAYSYFENTENKIPSYLTQFYMGICQLAIETPGYNKALSHFNKVIRSDNDYRQQALWYKVIALMSLDKKKEATAILNEIITAKNYNYKKAEEILKHIN